MDRKTPLYDRHVALGGRMVSFAGYLLPVQFAGVLAEHRAVREGCGLFDVSHMGEILIEGPRALAFLQNLLTNDMAGMADGQIRYSPMCRQDGGTLDDLLVYRQGEEKYLAVVNAANRETDFAHMQAHNPMGALVTDISEGIAQLALQGPAAAEILAALTAPDSLPRRYYTFRENILVAGTPCLVSRTGYTGEDGFELYCAGDRGAALWDALLATGRVTPCGLGARDTLRLEAGMPLFGHEMSGDISPLEAGLDFFVKLEKDDFIGREALLALHRQGPARIRTGLVLEDRGIAREGAPVLFRGQPVGIVTSGTQSPTLGKAIAMALVDPAHAGPDTPLALEVRGRPLAARTVELPFYRRKRR